jgi:hypothetical protein
LTTLSTTPSKGFPATVSVAAAASVVVADSVAGDGAGLHPERAKLNTNIAAEKISKPTFNFEKLTPTSLNKFTHTNLLKYCLNNNK